MFGAKVVLDSISPSGVRITSVEFTQPRFVHSEFLTHRDRARNAASSRAIPWKRLRKQRKGELDHEYQRAMLDLGRNDLDRYIDNCMYKMVMTDPVIPIFLGMEKEGMQAGEELQGKDRDDTIQDILDMRNYCIEKVDRMAARGLHKSICNRYLEPWMWITVLCTSTEWKQFFRLRCHPAAERHFQHAACLIRDAMVMSTPRQLKVGEWHMPYMRDDDPDLVCQAIATGEVEVPDNVPRSDVLNWVTKRVSVGRAARLSYLTHDGRRSIKADVDLANRLIQVPNDPDVIHASPLEHVAQCIAPFYSGTTRGMLEARSGPFRGWKQFRKEFDNENVEG